MAAQATRSRTAGRSSTEGCAALLEPLSRSASTRSPGREGSSSRAQAELSRRSSALTDAPSGTRGPHRPPGGRRAWSVPAHDRRGGGVRPRHLLARHVAWRAWRPLPRPRAHRARCGGTKLASKLVERGLDRWSLGDGVSATGGGHGRSVATGTSREAKPACAPDRREALPLRQRVGHGDDLESLDLVEVVGVARVDGQFVGKRGRSDHRVVGAGRALAAGASQ